MIATAMLIWCYSLHASQVLFGLAEDPWNRYRNSTESRYFDLGEPCQVGRWDKTKWRVISYVKPLAGIWSIVTNPLHISARRQSDVRNIGSFSSRPSVNLWWHIVRAYLAEAVRVSIQNEVCIALAFGWRWIINNHSFLADLDFSSLVRCDIFGNTTSSANPAPFRFDCIMAYRHTSNL